ncbi:hypothetical protein CWE15_01670 [Aliidiomarina taiwanensis]|uniref:Uncharacterized protein n=1 Tax=Aliidiomarina taiwanensis TaxID=946228 RepID=A0A432X951_9GAMM|nr:tetratricopeptide repeat protein [Aliidiomarina taiwanensis]RUO43918.1 hypothetical protein CWE15_01670 [Aliidiomarina taiwanensis]
MRLMVFVFIVSLCVGCSHRAVSDYELQVMDSRINQAYKRGDLATTEALLRRKLKGQKSDFTAWLMLGEVLMRSHDYSAAHYAYQVATELAPDHASAWYQLALSHLRLATEALIEADTHGERDQPLPLLLWLLELQTGQPVDVHAL